MSEKTKKRLKEEMKEIFRTQFNNVTMLIILMCGITNFVLSLLSERVYLNETFYSIGIAVSACLGGPVIDVLSALVSATIYLAVVNLNAWPLCIISVIIGFVVGVFSRKGKLKNVFSTYVSSVVLANIVIFSSYIIEILIFKDYYFEGQFARLTMELFNDINIPVFIAGIFAECISMLPQCFISMFAAHFVYVIFRRNNWVDSLMKNNKEESTDE